MALYVLKVPLNTKQTNKHHENGIVEACKAESLTKIVLNGDKTLFYIN